ncbi:MAG TPA: sigma-70 family RNA polymerase sigma factor [Edaphocola sp.]|nr:sigma-70 family RNA polymerase sigma factor [Edaphocola sp.]
MPDHSEHISDEKLLANYYKTYDPKWLGDLLARYTLLLFGVCMKYLRHEEEARDTVQQVYLKVLSAMAKTQVHNFGGWVYQITRNECLTRLRQRHERPSEAGLFNMEESEESLPVEEWMAEEQKFMQLELALKDLKTLQRDCINLFYFQAKSYQEIAEQLALTIKEVKSHIQNGKRNLKVKLETALHQAGKGGSHE